MARKKTQDEGNQEGGMTKAEAVRRALAEGIESPKQGSAFIKERFGIEIAPMHFGAQKSQIRKRESKNGGVTIKVKRRRSEGAPAGGEPGLLEALEAIKPLVASLGADKVKRIVDLLG